MEGSNGSRNGERMIGTRGKIDAGRGIDSFRSGEPTERSRDDETAEDCQGHSSLDAPSELNPPQRIPSPLVLHY